MVQGKKGQAGATLLDYVLLVACISFIALPALSQTDAFSKPYMCAAEAIQVAGGGTWSSMNGNDNVIVTPGYDISDYQYCDSLNTPPAGPNDLTHIDDSPTWLDGPYNS
ncbi:MAG: hypothetical protein KDD55_04320 [Bdellovibrionales bacterium]|nr:hypothetical protein [Bdellovibrionales bacterium]